MCGFDHRFFDRCRVALVCALHRDRQGWLRSSLSAACSTLWARCVRPSLHLRDARIRVVGMLPPLCSILSSTASGRVAPAPFGSGSRYPTPWPAVSGIRCRLLRCPGERLTASPRWLPASMHPRPPFSHRSGPHLPTRPTSTKRPFHVFPDRSTVAYRETVE